MKIEHTTPSIDKPHESDTDRQTDELTEEMNSAPPAGACSSLLVYCALDPVFT